MGLSHDERERRTSFRWTVGSVLFFALGCGLLWISFKTDWCHGDKSLSNFVTGVGGTSALVGVVGLFVEALHAQHHQ